MSTLRLGGPGGAHEPVKHAVPKAKKNCGEVANAETAAYLRRLEGSFLATLMGASVAATTISARGYKDGTFLKEQMALAR
jgi:hypothetical protein